MIHLFAVTGFTGAHYAMQVASCTQFENEIDWRGDFGAFVFVQEQPTCMVVEKTH